MAYIQPQDQQAVNPASPATQTAPVAAGGQGVAGKSNSPQTPGVNVPAQPSAQLSAYLNASAPQAAQMAGNVAGTVGGQINSVGNAILPAVNTYTGQLANVPTNTDINQSVEKSPASLTPAEQQTFKTELSAEQNTPNSASTFETTAPYQSLTSQVQAAVEQANLWNAGNDVSSIKTALSPFESPTSTSGDTTLDALLLSQSPSAYSQIQQAVAPAANLQNQLTAGTTQADQYLQQAIANDIAATQAAQGAGQTYATNLQNYLNQAVVSERSTQAAQEVAYAKAVSDLASGNITPTDANLLGLSSDNVSALQAINPLISKIDNEWNTDGPLSPRAGVLYPGYPNTLTTPLNFTTLAGYLYPSAAPVVTPQNVATSQNYADVAALNAMMGANAPAVPLTSATANQAGSNLNVPADAGLAGMASNVSTQLSPAALATQSALTKYLNYLFTGFGAGGAPNGGYTNAIDDTRTPGLTVLRGDIRNLQNDIAGV